VSDDEERARLGSSGVFRAIVDGARRVKRALSESDDSLPEEVMEVGNEIGRCFITGRFADIYVMSAKVMKRTDVDRFVASWRDAVEGKGPFTRYEVSNAGDIELAFVPSLEDVPQQKFVAFLEISFANPDQDDAFTIGAVLIDDGGVTRIAALHAR